MVSSISVLDSAGTARTVATADALATLIGEVQASPTSNTLLDRLKTLATALGTGATGLGKAEDAGHTSGDVGVPAMTVRQNTAAALAGSDADYQPLITDANGRLHVVSHIPAAAASIAKAEDAAHSDGDVGVQALTVRKDTAAATSGTDGDYQPLITDSAGRLHASIAGNLYTEDAAAASDPVGPVLIAVRRDTLSASEVSADGDNVALKADARGALHSVAHGAAAHDAAISGNPVRIGGRALSANYTAVAAGDQADLITTLVGALITKPFSLPGADWAYAAAASGIANTTTAVTVKAAGAAGLKNYITGIDVMWEALTTATEFAIRDGAGGTVLWRFKIPASAAGHRAVTFPSPLAGTAATLLEIVTLTASGAGAVYANLTGFVAP